MQWFMFVVTKNYANFSGRAGRSEFWFFMLVAFVANIVLGILDSVVGLFGILGLVFSLGIMLPSLAVGARRLHDIGRSGWWQLLLLVPVVGIIGLIVLWAMQGEDGANAFGPPPPADPEAAPAGATA